MLMYKSDSPTFYKIMGKMPFFRLFLKLFMRRIMTYVKHNKWMVFSISIVIGGIFFAFKSNSLKQEEPLELRHRKLLSTIGRLLESEHYSPRVINDVFSKDVFAAYIKALDGDKSIFTQEDMYQLSDFKTNYSILLIFSNSEIKNFSSVEEAEKFIQDRYKNNGYVVVKELTLNKQ